MASSEDFKKYIQAGKLTEALALAMSAAVKLQITTRVLDDEDMAMGTDSQPGDRLRTQINMVEGQITNEIGEQFTGKNPYKDLKQAHLEQVKDGAKTIQNNLKSLQKLFRLLVAMRQQNLLDVTPTLELNAGLEQSIPLPPMRGYEVGSYEAIAPAPEPINAAAYDLTDAIPVPDSSIDYPSPPEETTTAHPESNPELDRQEQEIDPLVKYGLLATAGAATVAAVAGMTASNASSDTTTETKEGRSVEHESLAEIEPEHEESYKYVDSDEDNGDATVIQLATVAYSPSATYVPIPPLAGSETAQIGDSQSSDTVEEIDQDFSHEDWEDFGENLPVETVSQMPHNAAEIMAATLEATQLQSSQPHSLPSTTPPHQGAEATPELVADEDTNLDPSEGVLPELVDDERLPDWEGLELSPLSAAELSSFADTQEAAWEDDWEDEPDVELPRQMPPAPPIVTDYSSDQASDYNFDPRMNPNIPSTDDQSWDEVEEEFNFPAPSGGRSTYGNDLDDEDFELIGDVVDTPDSSHNSLAAASDMMEDIFGDLDDTLLPKPDSKVSKEDDFFDFDLEEPPSPHK